MLAPIEPIENPLAAYPNRDWEDVYRDLYRPDSTYHYLCAPNDTHGCLLRASVKNGVAVYADASFGYHKTTDLYGNKASNRWDPRACVSGLAYVRRMYSDRRVKGCYVRSGFMRWVDDGTACHARQTASRRWSTARVAARRTSSRSPTRMPRRCWPRCTSMSPPPTAATRAPRC